MDKSTDNLIPVCIPGTATMKDIVYIRQMVCDIRAKRGDPCVNPEINVDPTINGIKSVLFSKELTDDEYRY